MGVREDLPEISGYLDEIDRFYQGCDGESGEQFFAEMLNPESETYLQLQRMWVIQDEIIEAISKHNLSKQVKESFIKDVEDGLEKNSHRWVKIIAWKTVNSPGGAKQEWFDSRIFSEGSTLDETIWYSCHHPTLGKVALERWKDNPRVSIEEFPDGGAQDLNANREKELERHGIPADLSSWFWTVECLDLTSIALQRLGLNFKLSDFVEWTCTGEPPNMHLGEAFGEPELHAEAVFGTRIATDNDFTRLEGVKIWKRTKGTFVSPLWEYLSWRGSEGYGALGEYARTAGDIGEGIDAAVICSDPEYDPEDTHRLRLTPNDIFRAGEAMMRLRVKVEFDDDIRRGRSERVTIEKRTQASGRKSMQARETRRAGLLDKIEALANQNPVILGFGAKAVAKLALQTCIQENPALWRQGKGQILDYIGEIRRGDAGPDMQARFQALFGTKPL